MTLPFDDSLLPADGAPVLAAVSGGADSLALLLGLIQHKARVVVAHVHHGTRGSESDADENFVRAHCHALDVPFLARRVCVEKPSEAALRDARYQALVEMACEANCRFVAAGHTADDALETVLVNLLRGATIEGFAAFAPVRALEDRTLIRPLWQATRSETQHACAAAGWIWREDSSNADAKYLRNAIRHKVRPNLGVLCRGGDDQLARQTARGARILRDEFDFLDAQARSALQVLILRDEANLLALDGCALRALHVALQRRILRVAAQRVAGEWLVPDSSQVEALRRAVEADARRQVWCWSKNLRVEWTGAHSGNRVRLWRVDDAPCYATAQDNPRELL